MKLDEAIKRISSIKRQQTGQDVKLSQVELIQEYFRRSAKFLHFFEKNVKMNYVYNAAEISGIEIDIDVHKLCPVLNSLKPFPREICKAYIEWCYLIDCDNPTAINFKGIYEPIIKFYERGGEFYCHHGDVGFGKYLFSPGCWDKKEDEIKDINDNVLDDLDKP